MARRSFSSENRIVTNNFDYPKFKLKKDERARIVILEDPEVFYTHNVRAPKVEDASGAPVLGMQSRYDGSSYETNVMEFVSNPICSGREEVLDEGGLDPEQCLLCAAAHKYPKRFQAPKRRYAVNIIRYRTRTGTFNLVEPHSVENLVWTFTDNKFNSLVDIASEHGDLRELDLNLGPCSNESFQNFDIHAGSGAAYLKSEALKKLTVETFKSGRIEDLSIAAGRKKEPRFMKMDIDKVNEAWAAIDLYESKMSGAPAPAQQNLGEDLSSLMDDVHKIAEAPTPAPAPVEAPSTGEDLDNLLSAGQVNTTSGEIVESVSPTEAKPAPAKAPAADLDDLLKGL